MPAEVPTRTPWKGVRKLAYPILWVVILGVFFLIREVLAPFIGAVLIAYLLAPLVRKLNRFEIKGVNVHMPRWVAVLLIYAVLLGVVFTYGMVAVPRIGAEFGKLAREGETLFLSFTPEKIDEYTQQVKDWVEEKGLPVRIVTPHTPHIEEEPRGGFVLNVDKVIKSSLADLTDTLRRQFFDFLRLGPAFAVNLFRNILMTFLILMVAAFMMGDPGKIIRFFRSLFPERLHQGFAEVIAEIDKGLAGVVRGQVLICLVNGVLTFIGLLILGVKFPVMLSTLAAVLSLIPIFGSILSSVPIVAVALTDGWGTGFGSLLWIIGIHLVEANLLNPKIMGESAKIHPALVILALVAGEHFYGIVGALFAVPVASVGLAFFKVLHRRAVSWNQEEFEPAESAAAQEEADAARADTEDEQA